MFCRVEEIFEIIFNASNSEADQEVPDRDTGSSVLENFLLECFCLINHWKIN